MSNARVAVRYAKALLDLSIERNELDDVKSDMDQVHAAIRESRDFINFLNSPVIKPHQKKKVVEAIFGSVLKPTTNMFLALLISHGRESITVQVIRQFHQMYLRAKGITAAQLTTASPLSAELRAKFESIVTEMTGTKVELNEKVDENIIGGFVLRVNDRQIDTSVTGQLHKLKQQYKDNLYVADY